MGVTRVISPAALPKQAAAEHPSVAGWDIEVRAHCEGLCALA
jgi:hypothetical protein